MSAAVERWGEHSSRWRRPTEVLGFPPGGAEADRRILRAKVRGPWWDLLAELGVVLLVTREYEHLLVALGGKPRVTFLPLAHPSGLAAGPHGQVLVASTRNPNQVFELRPTRAIRSGEPGPLLPVRSWLHPGSLYLHDLAWIGGTLHANAVGHDAVVALPDAGGTEVVWWPRCAERAGIPRLERNTLQLNSIAAGATIADSFFTASTDRPSSRRPGHRNFAVDRRGVVFSGSTGETVARGLTRPHSARLHNGRLWVDDSGYGRLVTIEGGQVREVGRFPGWTRGLAFRGNLAFVGTSRVIPRFRHYAPGLDVDRSECAVHAFDLASGRTLASIVWPEGNQIFAIEPLAAGSTSGLPGSPSRPGAARERDLFFSFAV